MSGAAALPSATPSPANQSANAAPPRAATSLAKRASSSKSSTLPGFTVVSVSGLGTSGRAPGSGNWPKTAWGVKAAIMPATTTPQRLTLHLPVTFPALPLERFHNSRALSGIVRGGIFLRKMPLDGSGFRVQQLWNRFNAKSSMGPSYNPGLAWAQMSAIPIAQTAGRAHHLTSCHSSQTKQIERD